MRSVYRFEVPVDDKDHTHTLTGKVVHVGCRRPQVVEFWAIHVEELHAREHRFRVIGTGHPIPDGLVYVGTALDEPFVWHLLAHDGSVS
jgi:hypothetical protein